MSHLVDIQIDDSNLPAPTPEIEQERRVAVFDLLEENSFALPARDDRETPPGPYRLNLSIRDRRLVGTMTPMPVRVVVRPPMMARTSVVKRRSAGRPVSTDTVAPAFPFDRSVRRTGQAPVRLSPYPA